MKPIQRVLLGLDLTSACHDVWTEACAVSRVFDAEVHIVHTLEELAPDSPGFSVLALGAEGQLNDLVRACRERGARISPHYFIRGGAAASAVLACARDLDADLIVIGAGPRAGVGRVIFGNSAERIVREAEPPVWVVHPGQSHTRFERVLAAVDPVSPQREVIHAAGLVARASRGRLQLLAIASARGAEDAPIHARLREAVTGTAAEALDVQLEVRHAPKPAPELVLAAERASADLLVMGDTGHGGLRRLLEGNTVEKVLRVAPCSILRVRPPRRRVVEEVA